jgi:D-alanyl-D-alanine carboxypeptidase
VDALSAVVDEQLARLVGGGLPGAFVLVEDSDGSSTFRSAGVADRSAGRSIHQFDRYRIGSTTKTFTAVVMLQLVSDAKVELDDRVVERLPELDGTCDGALTVEHLLRMRSGLFDFEDDPDLLGDLDAHLVPHSLSEVLEMGFAGPQRFRPGERFEYCNTNFCVLERIIERATGRSLGQEFDDRIFGPLGMAASSYPDANDLTLPEPFIHGYHWTPSGWRDCSEVFFGRGDGAIISSAPDVARFLRALLDGDLVSTELLGAMRAVVDDDPPAEERYGLGLIADELPHGLVWGHSGGGFGYRHWPFLDTTSGRLVICMTNGTSSFRTAPTLDLPQFSASGRSLMYTT